MQRLNYGYHHLIRDKGRTPVVIAPVQTMKETLLVFEHHCQCYSQLENHHQFQSYSSVVHQKHFLQLDSKSEFAAACNPECHDFLGDLFPWVFIG